MLLKMQYEHFRFDDLCPKSRHLFYGINLLSILNISIFFAIIRNCRNVN